MENLTELQSLNYKLMRAYQELDNILQFENVTDFRRRCILDVMELLKKDNLPHQNVKKI